MMLLLLGSVSMLSKLLLLCAEGVYDRGGTGGEAQKCVIVTYLTGLTYTLAGAAALAHG
jgi:hypothetical protein